jgi:hypothetical protein
MGKVLNNAYSEERCNYYERLCEIRPANQKYLKGWKNRARSFKI